MTQKIKIPEISKCWCGETAELIDWDFKMMYRVLCKNNHTLTKECITPNRAIHRWNNRVKEKLNNGE
jgi:hypothetical protein